MGGRGWSGGLSFLNIQTNWSYLAKGWHPVDDEMQDKRHALVPSVTEAMLLYVCQLSWPNSPRRTSVEIKRCLWGQWGMEGHLKGPGSQWKIKLSVTKNSVKKKNNKSDSIESRDHKNRSAQMCACPSMSLVAARPENLFLFFFFFCFVHFAY